MNTLSFRDRLQILFTGKSAPAARGLAPLVDAINRSNAPTMMFPDLSKFSDQIEVYRRNATVNMCILRIANVVALADIDVVRKNTDEDETEIPNHPFEQLLDKPNSYQSKFEFLQATLIYLLATGNAYWYLDTEAGAPTEMMLLRPDRVEIVPGKEAGEWIRGYVYNAQHGLKIPLPVNQVIHFKDLNPVNDYYGMSVLEPLALTVQSEMAMIEWNRNAFKENNAIPAGIVKIKQMITDADYERIQSDWKKSYGGTKRATAFIRGGGDFDFQAVGLSQVESDFNTGRMMDEEKIMKAFGVPPGLLEKSATQANALAALETFYRDTVWPRITMICEKLSAEMMPRYGVGLAVEAEDIRIKDSANDRAEMQAAGAYLTINEIREQWFKLKPVPWGEVPAMGAAAVSASFGNPAPMPAALAKPVQNEPSPNEDPADMPMISAGKGIETDAQRKWFFANLAEVNSRTASASVSHTSHTGGSAAHDELHRREKDFSDMEKHHISLVKAAQENHAVHAALRDAHLSTVPSMDHSQLQKGDLITIAHPVHGDAGSTPYRVVSTRNGVKVSPVGVNMSTFEISDTGKPKPLTEPHRKITSEHLTSIAKASQKAGDYRQQISNSAQRLEGQRLRVLDQLGSVGRQTAATKSDGYFDDPDPDLEDMPRYALSKRARAELEQFQRYASKGKPIDAFKFLYVPVAVGIAAKAWIDVAGADTHAQPFLSDGIKLDTSRISLSGVIDPNSRAKDKYERDVKLAMQSYLTKLQLNVIKAVKQGQQTARKAIPGDLRHYLTYFDAAFWADMFDDLEASMRGVMQDSMNAGATTSAEMLSMTTGIGFDPSVFNPKAAKWALDHTDEVLKKFNQTSKDGVGALLGRWIGSEGATIGDLISAIQESPLFNERRAELVAITEVTRAFAQGEMEAGKEFADLAGVPFLSNGTGLEPPLHPNCRCWLSTEPIYENDRLVSIDTVFRTSNDPFVCPICAPYNDQRLSEAQEGE